MEGQTIYRVKNIVTGHYWTGNGFGSGGKIYTKRKFAVDTISDGRLKSLIDNGTYNADNIKVVRAIIIYEEIL